MEKRIVIITNTFPYGKGEQFVFDELSVLVNFHHIIIIPLFSIEHKKSYSLPQKISVLEPICNFNIKHKRKLLANGLFNLSPILFSVKEFFTKTVFTDLNHLRSWLTATLIARIVYSKLTSKEIFGTFKEAEIIYFYWSDTAANVIPLLKAKIPNTNILVRFHGSDLYEIVKHDYIPFRTNLLKSIDYALFVSKHGADYLQKKYKKIDFLAKIFRLGVNFYGLSKSSSDGILRIVSCSFLVPIKRIHIIINALSKISDINIEWTHLGDGSLKSSLIELSKILPSNVKCNFKGNLLKEELIKFYQESPVDLFINVSKSEGLPVSIMEAISFGIPVIATNVGGTSEIVSNELGYLVDKNITPDELAFIIKDFNHRNDKSSLKANAKKMFDERFNAITNYSKFSAFIEHI